MTSRYAELHAHSNFSFLDGASHPERLVERAAELGYEALAVTDHDGFYGLVKFWSAARRVGLPAVYGAELSLEADGSAELSNEEANPLEVARLRDAERTMGGPADRDHALPGREPSFSAQAPSGRAARAPAPAPSLARASQSATPRSNASEGNRWRRGRIRRSHRTKSAERGPRDHLVLLAPSPDGYAQLSRLVTTAQLRGEKDRPSYRFEDVAQAASGGDLVALSGCWQGSIPRAAQAGDLDGALRAASKLREIFGRRLHLELWDHRMPEDDLRNDVMWEVGQRLRLPVVATNNVHYADRRDADLAEVLAAIGGRRSLQEQDGFRPATDERYLKSPEEMFARFARYPGVVERAADLGRDLAFDLRLVAPSLPNFPMPDHFRSEMDYLRHLTFEGARRVYPGADNGRSEEHTSELQSH